jgi:hypothetical protein
MNTEDDEFKRIEAEGWRKRQLEAQKVIMEQYRNVVLEEVAREFDKMKFSDTSVSFAIFVREMKK